MDGNRLNPQDKIIYVPPAISNQAGYRRDESIGLFEAASHQVWPVSSASVPDDKEMPIRLVTMPIYAKSFFGGASWQMKRPEKLIWSGIQTDKLYCRLVMITSRMLMVSFGTVHRCVDHRGDNLAYLRPAQIAVPIGLEFAAYSFIRPIPSLS